jgi:phosphoglucosamine mutase
MIEGALAAGLCSLGVDVLLLGVVPTPAVAFLIGKYRADSGIMISASHNSFEFNGIKIFDSEGYKLHDEIEEQIETLILKNEKFFSPIGRELGRINSADLADIDYISHIKASVPFELDGLKIAFDCANGSASRTAEKLFSSLGVECCMLFCEPDGININENCGSTRLENLIAYVKDHNLDGGIALDGDADRCLAVDETGNVVDGDVIMAICAQDLKDRGKLAKNTVVGTVMTNMGFNKFCAENGINFLSTKVGDRYVLKEMLKERYNLGGEQSGHVIFGDFATTGDGQLTAAQLLTIVKHRKKKLSSLAGLINKYPQKIVNLEATDDAKNLFKTSNKIKATIEEAQNHLGRKGRIVVRISGTEPLIRVMVEAEDENLTDKFCEQLARAIKRELEGF